MVEYTDSKKVEMIQQQNNLFESKLFSLKVNKQQTTLETCYINVVINSFIGNE